MQMGPSLEETLVLPSGISWRSREAKKEGERTMIFERTLAAGASLKGDIGIKEKEPGKLSIANEATVTRPAPRRLEYKEVVRWTGAPPENIGPSRRTSQC